MCEHHHAPPSLPGRRGSALEHGRAHTEDHRIWSRRDFLTGMTVAAAGGAFLLGTTPVRAYGRSPLLSALQRAQTDRVLVLIQLNGGNDGLNTIVPVENDLYYNARRTLAIPKNEAIALSPVLGMHPSMAALDPLYRDGRLGVVQNVGYPAPNLSHFRSTDIWLSASDSDVYDATGWAGRFLDTAHPTFEEEPPEAPLAVQIGGGSSLLFQGPSAGMGMSLASPELFAQLAEEGRLYDPEGSPSTTFGQEIAFVRTVANSSFRYAGAIQDASGAASNRVEYPTPNPLSNTLPIVSRLIKGNLGSRIYLVSLGGFDTHANQAGAHATLLRYLAEASKAFYDDLAADGFADRVLVMTFSEFGRRVGQNGSNGTDHGTAAPLFVLGDGVNGALYGNAPDLADLDATGNLKHEYDFRSVYATVLKDWFGLAEETVTDVLGQSFETIPFVSDPTTVGAEPGALPTAFRLHQNYPNPFNPSTVISYTLDRPAHVRLRVYDAQGREVALLEDRAAPAGPHTVAFDAAHLPSGTYFYRIETPAGQQTRQMVLVR